MMYYIATFSRNIYEFYSFRDKNLADVGPWLIPGILCWFNYHTIESLVFVAMDVHQKIPTSRTYSVFAIILLVYYYGFGHKKIHMRYPRETKLFPWYLAYTLVTIAAAFYSGSLVRNRVLGLD